MISAAVEEEGCHQASRLRPVSMAPLLRAHRREARRSLGPLTHQARCRNQDGSPIPCAGPRFVRQSPDWRCSPTRSVRKSERRQFLVGQCFVPRLHNRAAEFLAFDRDRALQTLKNDHRRSLRPASGEFRAGQRRILTGNTETIGLMTRLTVGRENLFAAVARRKFSLLLLSLRSAAFFCRRRSAHRIKSVAGKTSRITTQVSATGEDRDPVNSDQPNRKRLESNTRP